MNTAKPLEFPIQLPAGKVPNDQDLLGFLKSLDVYPSSLFMIKRYEADGAFQQPLEGLLYAFSADDAAKKIEQAWDANFDVFIIEVSESVPPDSELPKIILSNTQLDDLADEVIEALIRANNPPRLFVRAEGIVQVRRDEQDNPIARRFDETQMVDSLSTVARYFRETRDDLKAAHPTRSLAGVVMARLARIGNRLPPLRGISESPLLRADGSILSRPGYDPASQLFYAPRPGFEMPSVPRKPEPHEVEQAVALIDEALSDFPFVDDASYATAFAALLTAPLRELMGGLAPMFLFDAPAAGTGKGLLTDVISIISTGCVAAKMPEPGDRDDAEWRKRLTAAMLEGRSLLVLDNVERPIGSPSLAAALTAGIWQDRILGSSRTVSIVNRTMWFVTGNNLRLRGDLPRRAVWCRLDAKVPRPWEREASGFSHPNLLEWVKDHRGELLAAIFTLARAWISAGRPGPIDNVPQLGSYEQWRDVIGGILRIAEIPGFLANQALLYDSADEDTPAWAALLEAWLGAYGTEAVTTARIAKDLKADANPELLEALPGELGDWDNKGFTRRLGWALRRKMDMRFLRADGAGTLRIVQAGEQNRAIGWRIEVEQ